MKTLKDGKNKAERLEIWGYKNNMILGFWIFFLTLIFRFGAEEPGNLKTPTDMNQKWLKLKLDLLNQRTKKGAMKSFRKPFDISPYSRQTRQKYL